ncbi:nucleotide sugar dehydrogenase, partial [Bacteroidales bacterium OttesenSCG-928-C03]|nr:nucleotide sugar dehydrogenase [Bacteroidales bacterium OttesenSCG-928-C03]
GIDIISKDIEKLDIQFDAVILAVAHNQFSTLNINNLVKENHVVYDVKGTLDRSVIDGRL